MKYSTRREFIDAIANEYHNTVKGRVEQLHNCKAWIFTPDNSDFLILQSYATIVAAFQRTTGILWVFGFYSNTTVQHIVKFRNWIRYGLQADCNYPVIVRLYNDSRAGKRRSKKNYEDDFASVIATALNQR